jgi:hypothetical protein
VSSVNVELAEEVAQYYADPLGFVLFSFPWGEPGTTLAKYDGPDAWQRETLELIGRLVRERGFDGEQAVEAIRAAIASGHGIGKSTLVAWLALWLMSTRPHCKGTVTANTFPQLSSKTWAAIKQWHKQCITAHWFICTDERMYHRDYKESWFCTAQTCKAENSEAFAGQHAANSSSWYIFDEASAIPDIIWQVAEGGCTDGEPHWYAFGNPTRSSGAFYRAVFGSEKERWIHRSIDSREAKLTNKAQIDEWIATYGEDSDFVRVRVRGLPPAASELQFIDMDRVQAACTREIETLPDEPLIAGFDVSGGGSAWNVIRFRRGLDARSIPPVRIAGERGRDRSVLIGAAAELLRDRRPGKRIAAMFVDSAFGAAIVERLHTMGFNNVHEVSFGGPSPDFHQLNLRAYMYNQLKDWLLRGAIPDDEDLRAQITRPGYHINRQNKLVLESKQDMAKRGEASPDDADAIALTFAQPVAPVAEEQDDRSSNFDTSGPLGWMS